MKQMSTLQLGRNIYEINDATARKLITELSKDLDNVKVVDGKSAYEIAVENGFIGSETDWLASLKGEQGDTGNGISNITKKSTTNNIDTYTITFTNGNTIDYNITNGIDGVGISNISYKETDSNGNYIYTITLTDSNSYDIIVPKGDIGIQGIQGEIGETPSISATASVNNTVGTPSVEVTKSGTDESPSFDFAFSNLKGEKGDKGDKGNIGNTPSISATASVGNTVGTPSVTVTKLGTDENPTLNFAFNNLKGETGSQGIQGSQGVQGIQGLSAYQVAVQNGFSGTESEWLESLKGEEYDDEPIWKVQGELGAKNLLPYPYAFMPEHYTAGSVDFQLDMENQGCFILNRTQETTTTYTHRELYAASITPQFILPKGEYIVSDGIDDNDTSQTGQTNCAMMFRFADLVNGGFVQERNTSVGSRSRTFTVTEEQEQAQRDGTLKLNVRVYCDPSKGVIENVKVKPIIRYATDTDDTWRPYVYSNDKLTSLVGNEIGKNLIPYPYYGANNVTKNGINIKTEDGALTLNGISTGYLDYYVISSLQKFNKKGVFILSADFGENISTTLVYLQVYLYNGSSSRNTKTIHYASNASIFDASDITDDESICIRFCISSSDITLENAKISNIMLRKADIIDGTWKPYEMSNKQLTDAIISNGEEIDNESTVSATLKPNYFYLFTNAVESLTITLPSNRRPWNEFNFAFTTSSNGCNLALPSAVTWMGDTPTLDANTYYEVSIKNDKAVIA